MFKALFSYNFGLISSLLVIKGFLLNCIKEVILIKVRSMILDMKVGFGIIRFINNGSFSHLIMGVKIHTTAEVSEKAKIGDKTAIWNHSQVREDVIIGQNCNIGKNVYIDFGVKLGNNVKVQNNVSIYHGVEVEDDVFLGPSMVFTNDLYPRAFIWDENRVEKTLVKKGASIGANSTIICGNRVIGQYALVAAGSVVTKDVPDYGLVRGNPAKLTGFVCKCGRKLIKKEEKDDAVIMECSECNETVDISKKDFDLIKNN